MSGMRHLRVPSEETARWRDRLLSEGWLATGVGIQADEDHRLLPLNDSAPEAGASVYDGHLLTELTSLERGPQHWRDRLDAALLDKIGPLLPTAHEVQGDVLLVKLEPEVEPHASVMAQAMLDQFPHVRIVCADGGVTGEYRVRDLRVLLSRDGNTSTVTVVKEHGLAYTLDPSTAYFSARLSGERGAAMDLIDAHRALLGRRLVVHDPYAGVGPNLGLPLHRGAVETAVVGDLNGAAIPFLRSNLEHIISRSNHPDAGLVVREGDGRAWAEEHTLLNRADVLFVNLPHDGLDHVQHLLPLLADDALLIGWAIVDRDEEGALAERVHGMFAEAGRGSEISVHFTKGFSTTRAMVRLVVRSTTGS
ncbi:MAG: hypothetical protein ACPHCZ_00260 [Candidatus Poseidoniaceae archaeon]